MKIAGLQSEVMPKGNSNNIYITIQLFLPFDLRKKILKNRKIFCKYSPIQRINTAARDTLIFTASYSSGS